MRETSARLCEYCRFAQSALGLSRPILICSNKAGCEGKFYVIEPKATCNNFQPGREPALSQGDGAGLIPLTHGKFAIVDAEDYDRLGKYKWYCREAKNNFYAFRRNGKKMVSMHREIINAPEGLLVDHIDGDGLNNCKSNLRLCTYAENACNRRPNRKGSSKYKGVWFHKRERKWEARITRKGKLKYLGRYDDEIEAALAYDRKAKQLFGEFAYLNFEGLAGFRRYTKEIIFAR